jgi:predicted dithiol-disulfide oxidoreductase (DUF899 family)
MEGPGMSCFLRDGDSVFHTYSTYARGLESQEPKGRSANARGAIPNFSS